MNKMVAEHDRFEKATEANVEIIRNCFDEQSIECTISNVPTKYLCNAAYFHMLQKTGGRAVFIHIPTLKNLSEGLMKKIITCMEEIEKCAYFAR